MRMITATILLILASSAFAEKNKSLSQVQRTICADLHTPNAANGESLQDADSVQRQQVIDGLEKGNNKSLDQLLRSNAKHYWATLKEHLDRLDHEGKLGGTQKELLSYLGIVLGDTHQGNFGPDRINRKMRYTNIDLDDAAFDAAVFLDYLHFHIISQLKSDKITSKELLDAYVKGLSGEKVKVPDEISQTLQISLEAYEQQIGELSGKKLKSDGQIKKDTDFETLSDNERSNFKELLQSPIRQLPGFENVKVVDVVRKVVDRGGGENVLRLMVSLQIGRDFRLYEVKGVADSGVDVAYKQSKSNLQRLLEALRFFHLTIEEYRRGTVLEFDEHLLQLSATQLSKKDLAGTSNGLVNLRPKTPNLFEIANPKDGKDAYASWLNVTLYDAYLIGKWHAAGLEVSGRNSKSYAQLIKSNFKDVKDFTKELRNYYLDVIIEQSGLKK